MSRDLKKLINIYENMFSSKVENKLFKSDKLCKKVISEIKKEKNKLLKEDKYINVINNKKYFQYILLEDICKLILTEIKPGRLKKKDKGKIKNDQ